MEFTVKIKMQISLLRGFHLSIFGVPCAVAVGVSKVSLPMHLDRMYSLIDLQPASAAYTIKSCASAYVTRRRITWDFIDAGSDRLCLGIVVEPPLVLILRFLTQKQIIHIVVGRTDHR